MTLNGIDIASYQAGLNTATIPADFVIIKATEGTGYINPTWKRQADTALAAGKKLGLYHFQRAANPISEADYFVRNIKAYIGKAVLVLDYEANDVPGTVGVKQWLDRVYSTTGVRPMIYTSTSWENSRDFSAIAKANYGLWIAQYNFETQVSGYKPRDLYGRVSHWRNTAMFQYTSVGKLPGWAGKLDFDVFYGDRAAWDSYAAVNGKPTAAPKSAPAKPAAKPTGSAPIRAVQSWLNTAYGTKLVVDGFNGVKTHAALVVGIQTELRRQFGFKIGIDGIAGKDTDRALTPVKVQKGDSGNITKLIQANLICRGYAVVGGLDGKYGNGTAAAVRTFQAAVGLVPDAIAGGWTLKALF